MKKKFWKYVIPLGFLAAVTVVAAPLTLTSCSSPFKHYAQNVIAQNAKVYNVSLKEPLIVFGQQTFAEWQAIKESDPALIINTIKAYKIPAVLKTGFQINDHTRITNLESEFMANTAIFVNMVVTLTNSNKDSMEQLKLTIPQVPVANLSGNLINPPELGTPVTVNKKKALEINLDQVNMPTIMNSLPQDISNVEWTTAINLATPQTVNNKPNTVPYIPAFLYKVVNVTLPPKGSDIITITYSPNEQYKSSIEQQVGNVWNKYCDIIVKIKESPYLNKTLKTDFTLTKAETDKVFGAISPIQLKAMNPVAVYNKLKAYVAEQDDVQPLRNCLDSKTNTIYNYWSNINVIQNGVRITFTSNPDDSQSAIYNYVFNVEFNK
ncbi:hypothetical protein [Ureaplasma ceti]|uniref:Lipoprotein n=1 Tax=Ureaplasma ceti TaxID=3119530 RepID=A0ABP9U7W3_9BACT